MDRFRNVRKVNHFSGQKYNYTDKASRLYWKTKYVWKDRGAKTMDGTLVILQSDLLNDNICFAGMVI